MPGRDGKGPQGVGAGTGGRRGPCFDGAGPTGAGQQRGAGQEFAPRGGGRDRSSGAGRGPEFRKFKKVHTRGHRFSPV